MVFQVVSHFLHQVRELHPFFFQFRDLFRRQKLGRTRAFAVKNVNQGIRVFFLVNLRRLHGRIVAAGQD